MKLRVYYDGYADRYYAQYRWFGLWRNFKEFYVSDFGYCDNVNRIFLTKENAVNFLNQTKAARVVEKEREAVRKERAKKSGVVYEDTI